MTVIKRHEQEKMKEAMPNMPVFDKSELDELQVKATEQIEALTPKERGELVQKMENKFKVLANLPPENRKQYVEKLSDEEKLELVKTQILMMSIVRQQMQAQQNGAKMAAPTQQGQMGMDAAPGASAVSEEERRRLEEEVDQEVEAEIAKSADKGMPKDLA